VSGKIHIHVKNADGTAKFEINSLKMTENNGIKSKDMHLAKSIIEENTEVIEKRWNEYFEDK